MTEARLRSDYTPEDLELVKSACLTVVAILGAYLDELCIVGGLVPLLLIDINQGLPDQDVHPGSNDLDVALAIALVDDGRYEEIRDALKASDFAPDIKEDSGNPVVQRWKRNGLNVTIDWLIETTPEHRPGSIHHLRDDLGAVAMRGIELALNERIAVHLEGYTLEGYKLERDIPVCGPGAFLVLKALALKGRDKPKDAFDPIYLIRNYANAPQALVDALAKHAETRPELIREALEILGDEFATVEHRGPQMVADFDGVNGEERDQVAADAQGYVDDLLRLCSERGLVGDEAGNS